MIDKTQRKDAERYINFLSKSINLILEKKGLPFILIHGGDEDEEIAKRILQGCKQDIEIIVEDNPLYIKGIIGSSIGIIGSRFHSLVSALSQSVPALGTGWSHKYERLFKDYNFEEGLLSVGVTDNELQRKLELILSKQMNSNIKSKLRIASDRQKQIVSEMWDEVIEIIHQ
ncbi:Polysaccharide pyruvyl transferase [Candidatus Thiomargarita nelsonii]|uniref:Polysaccharide pyruvyl transferase n=1 Tax=Candidatus Thiomargarita nelsonii TaxID=1003181 RepID=A0A176S6F0_9GAMM|nr:Polysaccharide pyruvyl transferase [Candidatus Thiomargarita nelsonii]